MFLLDPSAASSSNSTFLDPITGKCTDINGCRTTTGILWSCLSVIFICTWVAIHPNVPLVEKFDVGEKKWSGRRWHPAAAVYAKIELMVVALLAPEFMILWAMRQREQAKLIRDKFKDYGWGISHGFLVVMGGFALYDGNKFCGYLWDRNRHYDEHERPYEGHAEEVWDEIKRHRKRSPENTQDDQFRDSEKDSQSFMEPTLPEEETLLTVPFKATEPATAPQEVALSVLSPEPSTVLEFLVDQGYISLTEDEIKDRSHADIITKSIAVLQTTWFIIQVIARASEGLAVTELEIITVAFAILNFGTYFLWWNKPLRVGHPVRVYWRQRQRLGRGNLRGENEGIWRTCCEGAGAIANYIYAIDFFGIFDSPDNIFIRLLLLPLWIPVHILSVGDQILRDIDESILDIPISSSLDKDPLRLYVIVYGIAALFGVIHCIPWVFQFPTHTEQLLWRISAVAVAVAPVVMGILHGYWKKVFDENDLGLVDFLVIILMYILSLAYAVFRATLIVIAFTSLRDLSPSAYQTVQWTTFFPHIG
ncbi:hypothetical protein VNI00_017227 [Paramarasmius palmivorus]|uniref:Uncharacterized protein n=1 Tax=Paramarasmius palmivorus TaxID=297713 RepID=A0AAW0B7K9_9AGAR